MMPIRKVATAGPGKHESGGLRLVVSRTGPGSGGWALPFSDSARRWAWAARLPALPGSTYYTVQNVPERCWI